MKTVIYKFGGTSMADTSSRKFVLGHINRSLKEGNKVIAIVSAMGRAPSPYATDTLASLAKLMNDKEKDRLISIGEIISTVVIGSELKENKIDHVVLSNRELGIITDDNFTNASVIALNTSILKEMNYHYDVVVAPGFQGMTLNHEITTLGRGGSDLTAMLIATALNIKEVSIFTDVDGVYSNDPKLDYLAYKLDKIDYDHMNLLIKKGANVMNGKSVEWAQAHDIEIHVRNTWTQKPGTLIGNYKKEG